MVDADRADVRAAPKLVRFVPRQQDDLPGADRHGSTAAHPEQQTSLRHVVIGDDMSRRRQKRAVVFGPDMS